MNEELIYDFEGILEAAAKSVLVDLGLTAVIPEDPAEFQQARPHIEVVALVSGGRGRWAIIAPAGETPAYQDMRESAWSGQIKIEVVTDADLAEHRTYKAKVRNAMAQLPRLINGKYAGLTRHKVQLITDAGASPIYSPETGVYQTTLLYNIEFSVQATAWADLQ